MAICSSTYTLYWTRGGRILTEEQASIITREQLYNEIWEISVAGVAKKYNANYNDLLKLCKEADVPVPPSGYWVKLQFGKPVEQISLPESSIVEVTLPGNDKPKRIRKAIAEKSVEDEKELEHKSLTEIYLVDTMHERKSKMAELSDGFIALPGGFGTMEELFEVLTWAQLSLHKKPVALLNVDGYYDALLQFIKVMNRDGFLKEEYLDLLIVSSDIDDLLLQMKSYVPLKNEKWFVSK